MPVDAVSEIVSLLDTNWNSANTDSVKPLISAVYDVKRIGGLTSKADSVLVYEGVSIITDADISGTSRNTETSVSIDLRSFTSRARLFKDLNEVDRILWANILGTTNFDIIDLHNSRRTDLSDRSRKLWRVVYDVKLIKKAEVRT